MAMLGKYKINETKVSSVMANNGLEIAINEKNGTMTVSLDGNVLAKDMAIGLVVQAAKMTQKIHSPAKFVCDVHGPFMKVTGRAQTPTCNHCLDEALRAAG